VKQWQADSGLQQSTATSHWPLVTPNKIILGYRALQRHRNGSYVALEGLYYERQFVLMGQGAVYLTVP
jgi:hypothetical protein